jgi:hypothetical protein
MGGCKLGQLIFFLTNASFPKNPYSNVKMEVYYDILSQMGNYMMVNELKKYIWRKAILNNFLTYALKE